MNYNTDPYGFPPQNGRGGKDYGHSNRRGIREDSYNDYCESNMPRKKRKKKKSCGGGCAVFFLILAVLFFCVTAFFYFASGDSVKNFIIAGIDEEGYRTDLILFCQIDKTNDRVSILQIPRDTKINNNRNDKKINSAYYSGIDVLYNEIEQVTGLRPENYAIISFEGFKALIDAVGGVKVDVPIDMNYHDPVQNLSIELKAGEQKLDGEKAEMFMRFRKNDDGSGYPNGDLDRISAQKQLYDALFQKLVKPSTVFRFPGLISAVTKNTETDFSKSDMVKYAADILTIGKSNISILTLPGNGKYIGGVSYFVHDTDASKTLISENFSSESGKTKKKTDKKSNKKNSDIRVSVVDATGTSSDITGGVKQKLEDAGFNVVSCVKWEEVRSKSSIIEYSGGGELVKEIFPDFPITDGGKNSKTDVTIILGKDFK